MTIQYDPQEITDWLSPLEKVYARQSKQLDLFHSQLKERDRQERAATFTAGDFNQILKNFGTLSKTAKAISSKREEGKYNEFKEGWGKLDFDHTDKAKQVLSEVDFTEQGFNVIEKLRKEGVDEKVITYIEQNSGHKDIRLKRMLGWEKVKNSVSNLDKKIEANEFGERDQFDKASRTGNEATYYRNELSSQLQKLGLSNKFIATHYGATIDKFATAKGLADTLDYKVVKFAQDKEETIASIENLTTTVDLDQNLASNTLHQVVKSFQVRDPVNGKNNAIIFLHRLAKQGKLNSSVIDAMKKGEIKGFEAGKVGEKLFSERDWKFIEKGEIEYHAAEKVKHEKIHTYALTNELTRARTGQGTNEERLAVLRDAKAAGMENTDEYKALERINSDRQNQNVYTDERLSIEDALQSGNVEFLKQEKERVTNENLKAEIQKTIDHLEGKQKQFGYSEKPVTELVAKSLELTVGVDGNYQLPLGADTVNNDLIRYFRKQFNALSQDPNVLDPYEAAKAATNEYWIRNGGTAAKYREGQPDTDVNNPRGKFTATHNGEFKLYDTYQKAKGTRFTELNKVVNEQEFNQIKTDLITNLNKAGNSTEVEGKTALERLLNTPESILSGSELKAVFENNQVSQKIITQAKLLGVTPQEIIVAQFNALAKDDPNKSLRNLDQSDIDNFVNPHLYIKEVLHKTKNTDLLYLLNREGIQNFSPKQASRLRKVLSAEAEVESTIEEADLNFERNKRLQRLKTLNITNVPASALESDEALDKFIAQQGLLEPK
tara:strand:+ start:531 stop:2861 length:2331 start_codon:yes stop_codon:yes gene_type:complete